MPKRSNTADEFKVVGKAYHEYWSIFDGPCTGVVFYCKNGAAAVMLDIDCLETEAEVGDIINPEDYDAVGWNLALNDERFWLGKLS